jgi:hypothetical protein
MAASCSPSPIIRWSPTTMALFPRSARLVEPRAARRRTLLLATHTRIAGCATGSPRPLAISAHLRGRGSRPLPQHGRPSCHFTGVTIAGPGCGSFHTRRISQNTPSRQLVNSGNLPPGVSNMPKPFPLTSSLRGVMVAVGAASRALPAKGIDALCRAQGGMCGEHAAGAYRSSAARHARRSCRAA